MKRKLCYFVNSAWYFELHWVDRGVAAIKSGYEVYVIAKEGANKRGNSSRLTQSFHFFMFEPIFSPVNALNQPI
ncbi:hypothetical protein QWY66_08335 [Klebsiella aerogenes]|nr:hypothetical protein [Klebsiella aerogenes]MDN3809982.1 hypothetical protein [Klebsiella aerogenes]